VVGGKELGGIVITGKEKTEVKKMIIVFFETL